MVKGYRCRKALLFLGEFTKPRWIKYSFLNSDSFSSFCCTSPQYCCKGLRYQWFLPGKKKKYYRPFLYFAFMFFLAPSAVSPRDHPITAREVGKFMNIGHLCLPASELGVFSFFCSLFSSFLIKKITKCLQMIKE